MLHLSRPKAVWTILPHRGAEFELSLALRGEPTSCCAPGFKSLLEPSAQVKRRMRRGTLPRIKGLFEFHHRESDFVVSHVHYFPLGSTLKFNQPVRNDLCISLLTLALY